ncbi:hypothetical protein EZY14_009030 [Kordia sp. TARA_039_SRF]|nr:hypothetical protein EZY14_009030 [Kordia sp. TARA_039_SRF]
MELTNVGDLIAKIEEMEAKIASVPKRKLTPGEKQQLKSYYQKNLDSYNNRLLVMVRENKLALLNLPSEKAA